MNRHCFVRRRLLVATFQFMLIARGSAYWLIYQFTLWNVLFCWRLLSEGPGNLVEQYGRFCGEYYPIWVCFLLMVPAFAWDTLRFSHRIAGPIHHVRKALRAISLGQRVEPIRLRERDVLIELADDCNAMIQVLEQRGFFVDEGTPTQEAASAADEATFDHGLRALR